MKNALTFGALSAALLLCATHTLAQTPPPTPAPAIPGQPQAQEPVDPAQAMRNMVRDISKYARRFNRNFAVVTQGGLELIEKVDPIDSTKRAPASTYMRSLDGVSIQGLNFRPPIEGKEEIKTDPKVQEQLIRLADLAKRRGLKVFVTDYGANAKTTEESIKMNTAKGFVPFAADRSGFNYIFDKIPSFPRRPINENPKNIVGLSGVQNILFLTDSSQFDRQQDFVIALSNTNFDAVVVDVFHKGRRAFTKNAIQGMKFKKLGARRMVFAYMNIGTAESYRYYWKDNWQEGEPEFITAPTVGNPDKFYIQYWHPGWRQIITGNTKSYLYGIVSQGYDGVLLDGLDSFKFYEGG